MAGIIINSGQELDIVAAIKNKAIEAIDETIIDAKERIDGSLVNLDSKIDEIESAATTINDAATTIDNSASSLETAATNVSNAATIVTNAANNIVASTDTLTYRITTNANQTVTFQVNVFGNATWRSIAGTYCSIVSITDSRYNPINLPANVNSGSTLYITITADSSNNERVVTINRTLIAENRVLNLGNANLPFYQRRPHTLSSFYASSVGKVLSLTGISGQSSLFLVDTSGNIYDSLLTYVNAMLHTEYLSAYDRIYVYYTAINNIVPYLVSSKSLGSAISLSTAAYDQVYSSVLDRLYISQGIGFAEINPASNTLVRTVIYESAGDQTRIALYADRYLYILRSSSTSGNAKLLCYNLNTSSWIANIILPVSVSSYPSCMAIDNATKKLFVGYTGSAAGTIRVVDINPASGTFNTIIATTSGYIINGAMVAYSGYIYFADINAGNFYRLDPATYNTTVLAGGVVSGTNYVFAYGNTLYFGCASGDKSISGLYVINL